MTVAPGYVPLVSTSRICRDLELVGDSATTPVLLVKTDEGAVHLGVLFISVVDLELVGVIVHRSGNGSLGISSETSIIERSLLPFSEVTSSAHSVAKLAKAAFAVNIVDTDLFHD